MDIDLIAIVRTVVRNFRLLALAGLAGAITGIIYLHVVTYRYSVTLELVPVQGGGGANVSSMLGGLSGLANLAGVSLPTDSSAQQRELYVAQLTSPYVANDLLANRNIALRIFSDRWDNDAGRWKTEAGFISKIANIVRMTLGAPQKAPRPPTTADMQQVLQEEVNIVNPRGGALITVTYANADPEFAKYFLLQLHQSADNRMRRAMVERSTKYIEFVNNELKTVTATEQRQALIQTLSEQQRYRMFAGANTAYVVDIFSPPVAANDAMTPKPIPTMLTMVFGGAVVGIFLILTLTRLGTREIPLRLLNRSLRA
jgi:hypothetical protein